MVDFRPAHTINGLLGFNKDLSCEDFQESENVVNLLTINSLLANVDIISCSYVNGSIQNTIYSFFPNVSPEYEIIEAPKNLVYLLLTLDTIHTIEAYLTDQDGHLVNWRGENLTMRFHIREV